MNFLLTNAGESIFFIVIHNPSYWLALATPKVFGARLIIKVGLETILAE